jgi:hypothetical protein
LRKTKVLVVVSAPAAMMLSASCKPETGRTTILAVKKMPREGHFFI